MREARERFKEFSGHDANQTHKVRLRVPKSALLVGELDGVLYTTVRDGKTEKYIHKFRKKSRPLLAAAHDGNSIHILGGEYEFTERGILDK
jgi:hypothetical protein